MVLVQTLHIIHSNYSLVVIVTEVVDSVISTAEEAKETSPQTDSKCFDEISKLDFDDSILFSKKVRKKGRNKEQNGKTKHPKEEDVNCIRCVFL